MVKILIAGGTAKSLINFRGDLIKEWVRKGYEVIAIAPPASDKINKEIEKMNINFIPVPMDRDSINPIKDFMMLLQVYQIIKVEKPDHVIAYMAKPVIYMSLVVWLFPKVESYSMITGIGHTFTDIPTGQKMLRGILTRLYKLALKNNKVVFFQNPDDPLLFRKLDILMKDQKIVITSGSGVNLEHFYFTIPSYKKELVFLMMGRMLSSKGVYEYINAAKILISKYDRISFKLLGFLTGRHEGIGKEEIDKLKAEDAVQYLGHTDDVRPYIIASSVYVLPSYYREGVPHSTLEAMAMGRPIITTDAPGCRETVIDGVNGFLIPIKDSMALAEAMETFILDPKLIEKMGAESRKIAEEKFDVRKVNKIILEAMGFQ